MYETPHQRARCTLHIKEQESIMNVGDAGSGWIEALPINDRTTLTVMKGLSAVAARFGVTNTLVSSNGPKFVRDDFLKHGASLRECKKKESTIYHPIIGQAENKWGTIISQFLCVSPTSTNDAWRNFKSERKNSNRKCL